MAASPERLPPRGVSLATSVEGALADLVAGRKCGLLVTVRIALSPERQLSLSERILTHHLGSIGATVNGDVPHIGYAPPGVVLEGMLPSRGMFDASVMNNGSISSPMASLHDLESTCIQHRVQYAYYKHLWAVGARHDEALQGMSELANRLSLYPCGFRSEAAGQIASQVRRLEACSHIRREGSGSDYPAGGAGVLPVCQGARQR